jgi:hypothetical protein
MELEWSGLFEAHVKLMRSVCVPQAPEHQGVNCQEVNHKVVVSFPSIVHEDPNS